MAGVQTAPFVFSRAQESSGPENLLMNRLLPASGRGFGWGDGAGVHAWDMGAPTFSRRTGRTCSFWTRKDTPRRGERTTFAPGLAVLACLVCN